jgi:glyoxylase-like metal-dependent hydrolase (beta-lactamase superfamily II)
MPKKSTKPPTSPAAPAAKSADGINYLFPKPQDNGEIRTVAPGLHWLRLPLPFGIDHVNCWLLEDAGGGWTIVDTGANKPDTSEIWTRVLPDTLNNKVNRLIGTHGHPDHIGLAGWIVEQCGATFVTTLGEWLSPQVWRAEGLEPMRPEIEAFYRNHGCPAAILDKMRAMRASGTFRNYPMPPQFSRIRDGDEIAFGGRSWTVLVNGGHADDHASFFCAADKILIAGDQILSKISPVVGVFSSQPLGDPLTDYLKSLDRLRTLPADTLVLPSHGLPFHGLHARVDQLKAHHASRLEQLVHLMSEPKAGFQLAFGLFERAMMGGETVLALAETLAHAHRLITEGRAEREISDIGLVTYRRTAAARVTSVA